MAEEHTLGAKLRRIREEAGLSQEELMGVAGVHRTQISEYERGERIPKLITLERISRGLGVPLDRFLTGEDRPGPPPDNPDCD